MGIINVLDNSHNVKDNIYQQRSEQLALLEHEVQHGWSPLFLKVEDVLQDFSQLWHWSSGTNFPGYQTDCLQMETEDPSLHLALFVKKKNIF